MKTSIKHFHKKVGHWLTAGLGLFMLLSAQLVSAQTKNYLNGTKTGNFLNTALLGPGSSGISSPISEHSYGVIGFRYYYGNTSLLTGTTTESAKLTSTRLNVAAGLSGADVYLQFRNTNNAEINAGTTTYFKLGAQPVNSGINVNLGALLGLSNLYNIKGHAYKNASDYKLNSAFIYNGEENVGQPVTNDASTVTKLVIDKDNQWTAAVTPTSTDKFNSVRLNVALPAGFNLLSLASVSTDVHNAYTITPGGNCSNRPIFTSFGNTGISLTAESLLAGLSLNDIVKDAYKAIDDDATSFSSFNSGVLNVSVASTVAQEFLFDHVGTANDAVKIHFALGTSIVALDLLSGGVTFKAFKGTSTTPVKTESLEDGLKLIGLNLANILTINNGFADINTTFKPGVEFDRIELSFNAGLVSAGVLADVLRIYDVEMSAPAPTISSVPPLGANNSLTVYVNQPIRTITATSAGNNILWYQGNSTSALAPAALSPVNLPVTSLATAGSYIYYAAAQRPTCSNISAKVPVNITVLPLSLATLPGGTLSTSYTFGTPVATSTGRTLAYEYTGTGLQGTGLTVNPTTGVVSGTPLKSGTFTFTVKITDTTGGGSIDAGTHTFSVTIVTNLIITGGPYPAGRRNTPYSQQLPAGLGAAQGVAPYTYVIIPPGSGGARVAGTLALPGGLSLSTSGLLSGTPTEVGTNTFTVQATDAEGSIIQANFTVQIEEALPVTLVSFSTVKEGESALLKWSTSAETNSDRFEIERSQNGKSWGMIGTKKSNGESLTLKNYNFTDAEPLAGENLYRLKMVDHDGTFAYSRIESLTFEGITTSFYPNPVAEKLVINTVDISKVKSVQIFDASGRTVYQSSTPTKEINVQNFASGLYVIKMTQKNGTVVSSKIVKQ